MKLNSNRTGYPDDYAQIVLYELLLECVAKYEISDMDQVMQSDRLQIEAMPELCSLVLEFMGVDWEDEDN